GYGRYVVVDAAESTIVLAARRVIQWIAPFASKAHGPIPSHRPKDALTVWVLLVIRQCLST
ncbi:MAG: hypothetical protein ABFS02_09670, partial [Pseudomonadota bacterium]